MEKILILNYPKKIQNIFIKIEDDGPGIPENEYDNVI
jgi:signal transduction histidine kinase